MLKHITRGLSLAFTLALLAVPTGKALAQSQASSPAVVTGTDPDPGDPQMVKIILILLNLA
jgi:hypothetical protein